MANYKYHKSCDNCGSSDGCAVYDDGSLHCFVCSFTVPSKEYIEENKPKNNRPKQKEKVMEKIEKAEKTKPIITQEERDNLKELTGIDGTEYRGISAETHKFFGVRTFFDSEGNPVEQYYPCTQDGKLTGYKKRELPKKFGGNIGRTGKECELFGQFRFQQPNSKYCLIVGGEVDTLSAYQMLNDYRKSKNQDFDTVVVSPTVGETGSEKQLALQYEWFNQFEKIIVGFDSDDAGQEAALKAVRALPKGKVFIANWTMKDPNEFLKAGEERTFVSDFFNAKKYVPTGVLASDQLYDRILSQSAVARVPFPQFMSELNDLFAGGLPLGHIINVAADTGLGKCFAKGTKIRMYDMTVKSVEDIRNGDLVMGDDGTARTVSGITSGFDKLYKISQVKGISYTVNSAHILSLRASTDIKTLSLKAGDVYNVNVESYLDLFKTHQSQLKGWKADISNFGSGSIEHDYLIGLWLGDGTSAKPQFTISKSEPELENFLYEYVGSQGWSTNISPTNDRVGCTMIDVKEFRGTLISHGLLNNKHIPSCVFTASVQTRLNVLAGLIDADGYLSGNCYTMTMKKNQLAFDIVDLTRSVGLNVTVNENSFKKCQNFEGAFYVGISISGDINKIPVKLTKRKASTRKQIKNVLNTGITVEEVGEGEYFGFQVDGNHLFCLEDFTVTHNTTLVNEMIYDWIFTSPHKVGVVSMELDAGQYGEVLLSRHLSRKLALIGNSEEKINYLKSETVRNKADDLFTNEEGVARFYLLDNRDGSIEEIQETVEQLVISCGCKLIVLDPLQDILDGLSNEEQAVFMKWAKSMIKSHGITFVFINHMRKTPAGQSGADSEQNIMGSSTIIKSASANILLKRDKTSEDPIERNTTYIIVTKNRICGLTGDAGAMYYENETHTLWNREHYFTNVVGGG